MIPSFKTGNYEEGIRAGVTVLSGFLRGAYGLRQTEFKPQIAISILHLVLAILMVGVSFPSMLILYFVYFRCAVGGGSGGGSGSNGNSDYCGYDGYGGGGYDGGGFGGGSSGGGGGGGDW